MEQQYGGPLGLAHASLEHFFEMSERYAEQQARSAAYLAEIDRRIHARRPRTPEETQREHVASLLETEAAMELKIMACADISDDERSMMLSELAAAIERACDSSQNLSR
jgi:acetyl-CoA carboxylase carboxyltransferase component